MNRSMLSTPAPRGSGFRGLLQLTIWARRMPAQRDSARRAPGSVAGPSASAKPGLAVEQLAGNLQVAGVRGGLLDHMQDDPADALDLTGVLRVMMKAEAARCRRQRGDG